MGASFPEAQAGLPWETKRKYKEFLTRVPNTVFFSCAFPCYLSFRHDFRVGVEGGRVQLVSSCRKSSCLGEAVGGAGGERSQEGAQRERGGGDAGEGKEGVTFCAPAWWLTRGSRII